MQRPSTQQHQSIMLRPPGLMLVGPYLLAAFILIFISTGVEFVKAEKTDPPNASSQRTIGQYRKDVKAFMKLSKHDDPSLQRNAIYNLCALHYELASDSRFESSSQIQSFRVIVAKRLAGYVKEFKKQQTTLERLEKKTKRHSSTNNSRQKSNETGSFGTQSGDSQRPLTGTGEFTLKSETDTQSETDEMYQAAADSYHSMGQVSGGPNQLFDYAGGRFAPPWDHGPDLVALITSTIDPAFWRQNGGNGSIHYFRPLRVLVIGATTRVHDDTLGLLMKLRAAGQ